MEEFEERLMKILESGNDGLFKNYQAAEQSMLTQILKYIRDSFDYTKRKLDRSSANKRKLIALKDYLLKNGNFESNELAIKNYLNDVDTILDVNKKIIDKADFTQQAFTLEKKILFDDVTNRILNKDSFLDNLLPAAKQDIYKAITFNNTYQSLEKDLNKTLEDTPSQRYVKQISKDSINQFDGAIQDKAKELYKFNAFTYNGSLIETSRKTCVGLVKGSGVYSHLLISNYVRKAYFTKDIDKIIRFSEGNSGWIEGTTSENFATNRGGYSCRHRISYFRYVP